MGDRDSRETAGKLLEEGNTLPPGHTQTSLFLLAIFSYMIFLEGEINGLRRELQEQSGGEASHGS